MASHLHVRLAAAKQLSYFDTQFHKAETTLTSSALIPHVKSHHSPKVVALMHEVVNVTVILSTTLGLITAR